MNTHDIPNGTILICKNCRAEFNTYYGDYGWINHDNKTRWGIVEDLMSKDDFDEELLKLSKVLNLSKKERECILLTKIKIEKLKSLK